MAGLASAQMAIAIVLVTGGSMMLQSFWKLRYTDLGFSTDRAVTATVNLNRARYPSVAQQVVFVDCVLQRLRSVPGVEAAGFGKATRSRRCRLPWSMRPSRARSFLAKAQLAAGFDPNRTSRGEPS
jgi:hypothetical protein